MPNSGDEFFMIDGSLLPREELERFHQEREAQTACGKVTVIKLQRRRESATAQEIDRLRTQLAEAVEALRPFASCVFNDNGDVTVEKSHLRDSDYFRAYNLLQTIRGPQHG